MDKFVPDIYQKSIYTVDYNKLKEDGIKCILFDLDNTLVPPFVNTPNEKIIELFYKLKEMDFKIIIFSNSGKRRLEPFKNELDVDVAYSCKKPCKRKFNKIMNLYKFELCEVVIIGDQILTDVYGGNRVGIKTILINPISSKDRKATILNRKLENYIMKKLSLRNLFTKGKYYED